MLLKVQLLNYSYVTYISLIVYGSACLHEEDLAIVVKQCN